VLEVAQRTAVNTVARIVLLQLVLSSIFHTTGVLFPLRNLHDVVNRKLDEISTTSFHTQTLLLELISHRAGVTGP